MAVLSLALNGNNIKETGRFVKPLVGAPRVEILRRRG
jgi:hypothetical protein